MKMLALVGLFVGSLSVSWAYGQDAAPAAKAVDRGHRCMGGRPSQSGIPILSKVPHCNRLFKTQPAAPSPPAEMPLPSRIPHLSIPFRKAMENPAAASPGRDDDRLGHLLKAAEHLAAAGEAQRARDVCRLAEQQRQHLSARLRALEHEVAAQRRSHARPPQILVKMKVVELSRTKLRALGFDFAELDAKAGPRPVTDAFRSRVVDEPSKFSDILETLSKDRLAKVLAAPQLVVLSGRPACLHVGGRCPVRVPQEDGSEKVELCEYGTRVDLVATAKGAETVRLEIRPRISELVPGDKTGAGEQRPPALRVREIDTAVELKSGQTLVLGGLVQDRVTAKPLRVPGLGAIPYVGRWLGRAIPQHEEMELMLLATPTILQAPTESTHANTGPPPEIRRPSKPATGPRQPTALRATSSVQAPSARPATK